MSSIKAVLRKKHNAQNLLPIAIRITKDRKTSYWFTGQYIKESQWDATNGQVKKSHPDALSINQLILDRLSKANKKLIEAEVEDHYQSVEIIKKEITSKKKYDFFNVSVIYLKRIKQRKQFHQYDNEEKRIKRFKEFYKKDTLSFNQLTVNLLKRFEAYLTRGKKLAPRTASNYMISIRTIYNIAISEFWASRDNYPFGRGKYQIRFPETQKIELNKEEILLLENVEGITKAQQHALDVWLLSFYFAGIRVSDVLQLKWTDFVDDRLYYRMSKNTKLVSLKVPDKAKRILDNYKLNSDSKLVFEELSDINLSNNKVLRTRIKTVTRNFNRRLKLISQKAGIEKKISMHIARHSFGNISGDKIPIQMLQKLYRHSSITTTILYQSNFIKRDIDEALDKVINF
jgi:site-specific recombinase XerD